MNSNKTKLISNQQFSELQTDYLAFLKLYDQINNYGEKVESLTKQDYLRERSFFKRDVKNIISTSENMKRLYQELADSSKKDQVESIKNKIKQKSQTLDSMLREINQKDEETANKLGINLQIEVDRSSYNEDNNLGSSFNEQELILTNVIDEQKFLKEREQELLKAKELSSHIKASAEMVKQEIDKQGVALEIIENEVGEVVKNIDNGEEEIKKADKLTKINKTKCIWISVGIACIAIIIICLSVFL